MIFCIKILIILILIPYLYRLIMQDFINKFGECITSQTDVQIKEERWALSLQHLDKDDFLSFVSCLVLAKKLNDGRFVSTIV